MDEKNNPTNPLKELLKSGQEILDRERYKELE